jgi:hypothetical protein
VIDYDLVFLNKNQPTPRDTASNRIATMETAGEGSLVVEAVCDGERGTGDGAGGCAKAWSVGGAGDCVGTRVGEISRVGVKEGVAVILSAVTDGASPAA